MCWKIGTRKGFTKKSVEDDFSIVVLRVGNTGGANDPVLSLESGKIINKGFIRFFQKNVGLLEGSCIILNKTSYVDDAKWANVVKVLLDPQVCNIISSVVSFSYDKL